jgi:hypothetical protein
MRRSPSGIFEQFGFFVMIFSSCAGNGLPHDNGAVGENARVDEEVPLAEP